MLLYPWSWEYIAFLSPLKRSQKWFTDSWEYFLPSFLTCSVYNFLYFFRWRAWKALRTRQMVSFMNCSILEFLCTWGTLRQQYCIRIPPDGTWPVEYKVAAQIRFAPLEIESRKWIFDGQIFTSHFVFLSLYLRPATNVVSRIDTYIVLNRLLFWIFFRYFTSPHPSSNRYRQMTIYFILKTGANVIRSHVSFADSTFC